MKSKSFNSPLDNYNELMFNDDAGFELVNLQAQRDLNSLVKNDERRHVNRDRTTTIDKDETITVHGQRTEVVDKDETITIHQNRTEIVDKDETITIHKNRQERVDLNETLDIGGNRTETVHKSEQILIKGNRDKTVKGNDTLTVNKDRKETVNKSRSLTVDRTNTEFVKLGKSVTVGLGYATQVGTIMNTAVGIMQTEQIGRIKKSFVGKSYSITAGDEFKITVGKSSLVMNADGSIIITGSSIVTQAEKENKVIGKDVLINPPGASAGGGDDEYESNVMVDNYDKDGNLTESYDLSDNPSNLSAFAPVAIGAEAAAGAAAVVGGTIYEASKDSGEAIVNAARSAGKTIEGFRAAQMVMGASVANSIQGVFSSEGPKTGNDELDEVFEGSEKSDDGEYGYKYPGTQEELVDKLGGIEGAVQDIRDNGTSTTTLPDGRKVSTYPARESNGKPGFSISRPNKRKPAHKGDTQ
ncbi:bacteriophage T4 gp5 trimerisation domain-containing protein [Psychrobacter celer]|uniref:bacteriophage T4 gp5 trimerisation domain-containing protein n=1 Tax=Psychrobacter celer TaxID=306572 RepID=UPI003FD2B792